MRIIKNWLAGHDARARARRAARLERWGFSPAEAAAEAARPWGEQLDDLQLHARFCE